MYFVEYYVPEVVQQFGPTYDVKGVIVRILATHDYRTFGPLNYYPSARNDGIIYQNAHCYIRVFTCHPQMINKMQSSL